MSIHGLNISPPAGFDVSEVMVTLRGPSVQALHEPRARQSQHPIRANLIVHRRTLPSSASLDLLCGEACAELLSSVDQLTNLETGGFTFSDGADGRVIQFDFSAGPAATVRQFQVLRLDGDTFSTLTLTVNRSTLTDELRDHYFASLQTLGSPGDRP
jgi:hypothetical protein